MSPTVAVVPIETSPDGEVLVTAARVRIITNKRVDVGLVGSKPFAIHSANIGGSEDMVAIMEMVIIVVGISKVGSCLTCHIGCR